jgi:hypothetical protein
VVNQPRCLRRTIVCPERDRRAHCQKTLDEICLSTAATLCGRNQRLLRNRRRLFHRSFMCAARELHDRGVRRGKRFREDHTGVFTQRPGNFGGNAHSRNELDSDRIVLDQPEGTFELEPAVRVVDDLRALEAVPLVDKGVRFDRRAGEAAAGGFRRGLLHDVTRLERYGAYH